MFEFITNYPIISTICGIVLLFGFFYFIRRYQTNTKEYDHEKERLNSSFLKTTTGLENFLTSAINYFGKKKEQENEIKNAFLRRYEESPDEVIQYTNVGLMNMTQVLQNEESVEQLLSQEISNLVNQAEENEIITQEFSETYINEVNNSQMYIEEVRRVSNLISSLNALTTIDTIDEKVVEFLKAFETQLQQIIQEITKKETNSLTLIEERLDHLKALLLHKRKTIGNIQFIERNTREVSNTIKTNIEKSITQLTLVIKVKEKKLQRELESNGDQRIIDTLQKEIVKYNEVLSSINTWHESFEGAFKSFQDILAKIWLINKKQEEKIKLFENENKKLASFIIIIFKLLNEFNKKSERKNVSIALTSQQIRLYLITTSGYVKEFFDTFAKLTTQEKIILEQVTKELELSKDIQEIFGESFVHVTTLITSNTAIKTRIEGFLELYAPFDQKDTNLINGMKQMLETDKRMDSQSIEVIKQLSILNSKELERTIVGINKYKKSTIECDQKAMSANNVGTQFKELLLKYSTTIVEKISTLIDQARGKASIEDSKAKKIESEIKRVA